MSLASVLGLCVFFLFIQLNFRFFNTWGDVDDFAQWNDLLQVRSGILALVRPMDLIAGLLAPLGLWRLSLMFPPRVMAPYRRPALLLAVLMGLLHYFLVEGRDLYEEQTPAFYVLRQEMIQFQLRYGHLLALKEIQRKWSNASLQSIDAALYRRIESPDYPFMEVPLSSVSPLPFHLKGRPNVVLILMESFRAFESGAYGASPSFTPRFDLLAKEGVFFRRFYANGAQTVRGEFAIHSSYCPNFIGDPVYIDQPDIHIRTLPMILKDRGYSTLWIGSFSAKFENKMKFLSRHGVDNFFQDVPLRRPAIGWGPSDMDLFDYAFDVLSKQKEPFFAEIMTLSNHFPFAAYPTDGQAPPTRGGKLYQAYCHGIYYTDQAVGEFLERVRRSPLADNTVFILTGDHGIWLFPPGGKTAAIAVRQELFFRIPCLFWSPKLLRPEAINDIGSQIDIMPTLLDLMNIYTENAFLGNSLFRPGAAGHCALMSHDSRWNLRMGNDYAYDIGPEAFWSHYPLATTVDSRKVLKGKTEHMFFHADRDILETRGDPFARPLTVDRAADLESLAEESVAVFDQVLLMDRVFPPFRERGKSPSGGQKGDPAE
jgi:phosphoglycerol transferase MdoB-like AlkP superfamily enzyme